MRSPQRLQIILKIYTMAGDPHKQQIHTDATI